MEIKITRTQNPKVKPAQDNLGFGKFFTDHMFICDYTEELGWHDARVVPFQNISLSPAAKVFHYAQEMFEGLKAYKTKDGRTLLFRPEKNVKRMNTTNERMCIPLVDEEFTLEAIKTIVKVDQDWIPTADGTSLYIRPFIIATEPALGVHASASYQFIIILSPSGEYYKGGINPVKIAVEDEYVRAVKGGTGYAKVGGNYAASLIGQTKAEKMGYAQVLWLDGIEHKYVDEVGAMNVFFVFGDEVVTPALEGNILPGVTRASVIEMLKSMNIKITERKVSIEEVYNNSKNGTLKEMFGTGTAAVISPVGMIDYKGEKLIINDNKIGAISQNLYDTLTGIQWGKLPDKMGWTVEV
ncbi:branched-chain amino acid aminotransferase [Eubacteriales bacterium OttesenSCG-928-G02]|nr:branched-chain amino acid aminotransferase [Eubacteriales bacterium OttesenSCG-928-G02]